MTGATVIATIDALLGKHQFWTAWSLVWFGDGTGLLVSTPLTLLRGGKATAALGEADLTPLLTAMACRTLDMALRAARGLATIGDVRALGALLQLSRETDPLLRRAAAAALQKLHDPRARRRLLWMLDDRDAGVRGAALDAYAQLDSLGDKTAWECETVSEN